MTNERRSATSAQNRSCGTTLLSGAWLLTAAWLVCAAPAAAADLAAQARLYLDAQALQLPGDVEITVGEPDPRLALAECARAEPFIPTNARLWGRGHIGIRCVQGANWTVYLPVDVRIFAPAPVAARAIPRGQILGRDDFRLERVELTQWPLGELASPDQIDGRMATRTIAAAEPLRRGQLKHLPLIMPGDAVRVLIETSSFVVATDGKALTSAGSGEGVQVALETGKTVWGTANPGKVVQIK